ncbi:hypothetical protein AAEO50_09750 [Rossellomorea oryzaecorticis]|uniref:Uncharacterized protein n=1 Tax=Rossellomorea oryzaecorticis TaxID=1396505 RepID=A0ABU9K8Z7_9BACI
MVDRVVEVENKSGGVENKRWKVENNLEEVENKVVKVEKKTGKFERNTDDFMSKFIIKKTLQHKIVSRFIQTHEKRGICVILDEKWMLSQVVQLLTQPKIRSNRKNINILILIAPDSG